MERGGGNSFSMLKSRPDHVALVKKDRAPPRESWRSAQETILA